MALGRGLASLIPNRRREKLDEDVEAIDSMEVMEEEAQDVPVMQTKVETAQQEETQPVGIPVVEEDDDEGFQPISSYQETEVEETPEAVQKVVVEDEKTEDDISDALADANEVVQAATDNEAMLDGSDPQQEQADTVMDTFSDFEQLDDGETIPAPEKPMVTPLELDPQEDSDLINLARAAAAQHKGSFHQSRTQIAKKVVIKDEAPVAQEKEPEVAAKAPAPEVIEEAPVATQAKAVEEAPVIEKPAPEAVADSVTAAAANKVAELEKKATGEETRMEPTVQGDKSDQHEDQVQRIAIGDIVINPLQPRRNFEPDELAELKDSIDQHGILQPLVVQRLEDGSYQLIAGERRLRASKELGWTKVPCVIRRDVSSDQTRLVYALIENIQRENLNPIEMALAYKRLSDEYGLSHEEIGQRMGKARVSITNSLRVLQLPAEVQRGLIEGKISSGHARAILMIPDEEKQVRFYQHLLDEGLTVRKAETRARRIQRTMGVHDPQRQKRRTRHPLAQKYAPALEERFATDANVKFSEEKNRFEVILKAYNVKEFETLVGRLLGTEEMPDLSVDDEIIES